MLKGLLLLLGLATPLATSLPEAARGHEPVVVVLVSQDAPPFREALAGLRQRLNRGVVVIVLNLYEDPARLEARVRQSAAERPSAFVALGSAAVRAAIAHGGSVPIVAGMILDPNELAGAEHATGVYLQFSVAVELEWMVRLLPAARRVGVLYNSPASASRVAEARRLAPGLGLTIRDFNVERPEQLPDALAALGGQSDLIWGLLDPVVYNPETARSILLFSFRSMLPLVGPAPTWVRAGGLLALERDYRDIGAQCAELVERVLAGTTPKSIAPVGPRAVRYVLNVRTADQLRMSPSAALVRGAVEVIR
jgi:putative ABC transport system substrate-binding protein